MIRKIFHTFLASPIAFLVMQLPEVIPDYLEKLLPTDDTLRIFCVIVFLLPLLCIGSAFACAGTFLMVKQRERGEPIRLSSVVLPLKAKVGTLVPVALLVGVLVALGMTIILPALYFMGIYIFVPILVLEEGKIPWTEYLHRSKVLSKKALWKCLLTVFVTMSVGLGFEFLFGQLDPSSFDPAIQVTKVLVMALFSAVVSLWICYFFLQLKGSAYEVVSGQT